MSTQAHAVVRASTRSVGSGVSSLVMKHAVEHNSNKRIYDADFHAGCALDVSDLVALRWKRHFGDSFFPELLRRLDAGETGPELEQWIDRGLEPYGSDGRLLVRGGVTSYLREESPSRAVRTALEQLFAS